MSNQEMSEGGSPIYRYEKTNDPMGPESVQPPAATLHLKEIGQHIQTYVGKVELVFHEMLSHLVHIDIHLVAPTQERPFYTAITSGMSDRPMTIRPGLDPIRYQFAELMICLPAAWPIGNEAFKQEENYWPFRMLKFLARFPHQYHSWLCAGHTMPNGDPAQPYAANTRMDGVMLSKPTTVDAGFQKLQISPDKVINFYALHPLYPEEMNLKLARGAEALDSLFAAAGFSEILIPNRKSVLGPIDKSPGKRWWNWFS